MERLTHLLDEPIITKIFKEQLNGTGKYQEFYQDTQVYLIDTLQKHSFEQNANWKKCEEKIIELKEMKPVTKVALNFKLNSTLFNQQKLSNNISSTTSSCKIPTKNECLNLAINEFNTLLQNPNQCLPYLQKLNELLREYIEKTLNKAYQPLDPLQYTWHQVNDLFYPCPNENYSYPKKYSALQTVLIQFLRKHGLAKNVEKWIGFIPGLFADTFTKNGDIFFDDRLYEGLFHGKVSHAIQIFMLCSAMENNDLTIQYQNESDNIQNLTAQDILAALIENKTEDKKSTLFAQLFDSRHFSSPSFGDPHRLHSLIMLSDEKANIPILRDYIIDSFCKGVNLQVKALNEKKPEVAMTAQKLIRKYHDSKIQLFTKNSLLLDYSIMKEKNKQINQLDQRTQSIEIQYNVEPYNSTYARVKKNY